MHVASGYCLAGALFLTYRVIFKRVPLLEVTRAAAHHLLAEASKKNPTVAGILDRADPDDLRDFLL